MNIREIVKSNPRYSEINREERNYAALFYHSLMKKENVASFLKLCGESAEIGSDFGVYFEYSMLRDLWWNIKSEETKRDIIREKLQINRINEICKMSPFEINEHFGVINEPSKEFIQYPGKWALSKYDKNISDNSDFLNTCKFKWSFNIKPDIVIHLDKDHAICIEAKYESGEGSYPSQERDKSIFSRRGLPYVGQMDLQKYMMEDLLGIDTKFVFLVFRKENSDTHQVITWKEVFSHLDLSDVPHFILDMIKNVSK